MFPRGVLSLGDFFVPIDRQFSATATSCLWQSQTHFFVQSILKREFAYRKSNVNKIHRITIFLLILLASIKIVTLSTSSSRAFAAADEITGLPMPVMIALAAGIEIVVVVAIFYLRTTVQRALVVICFAGLILAYRFSGSLLGAEKCPCLGNLADWWPWLGRKEGPILATIALWLFLTSAMELVLISFDPKVDECSVSRS